MKWYDYVVCVFIADMMAAFIIAGSFLVFIPIFFYIQYEFLRAGKL